MLSNCTGKSTYLAKSLRGIPKVWPQSVLILTLLSFDTLGKWFLHFLRWSIVTWFRISVLTISIDKLCDYVSRVSFRVRAWVSKCWRLKMFIDNAKCSRNGNKELLPMMVAGKNVLWTGEGGVSLELVAVVDVSKLNQQMCLLCCWRVKATTLRLRWWHV